MMFNKILFSAVFILVLLFPLCSQADEYLLAMSKDDPVCQQVLALYNKDLKQHGKLIFENHSEYNWLEWDEDLSIFDAHGEKSNLWHHTPKLAVFDVNNDNKDETVLLVRPSLGGVLREFLQYYPLPMSLQRNNLHWPKLNEVRYSMIDGGGAYQLKEFPPQHERDLSGLWRKYYIDMGHFMYIRPLRIGDRYYVSLFGSEGQGDANIPLNKTNIAAISKFDSDNTLHDICYFIKAYTLNKEE